MRDKIGRFKKGHKVLKKWKNNIGTNPKSHQGRKQKPETKEKIRKSLLKQYKEGVRDNQKRPRGKNHPNWKGGRRIENGYVYLYSPNMKKSKGIAEHRLVMEKKIGRKLKKGEIVHHINKNRSDNRPQNLLLVTRKTHREKEGKLKVCCPFCENEFGVG